MIKKKVVIASGYFNPVHMGHINMFNKAKKMGDRLFVIVNNDAQVTIKGGVAFMGQNERLNIIKNIKSVDEAFISVDKDSTVCESIRKIRGMYGTQFDYVFANGGDRKNMKTIPESAVCKELGIRMEFNVGGRKTQSSSTLIAKASKLAHKK